MGKGEGEIGIEPLGIVESGKWKEEWKMGNGEKGNGKWGWVMGKRGMGNKEWTKLIKGNG